MKEGTRNLKLEKNHTALINTSNLVFYMDITYNYEIYKQFYDIQLIYKNKDDNGIIMDKYTIF